jgi:hypothetical protein
MDLKTQEIINLAKKNSTDFIVGNRNSIKLMNYDGKILSIKTFKTPSFFIGFIYRFFRTSKAKRSYLHAKKLQEKNIGTPIPVGFYENNNSLQLLDSYYICEHLDADFVFKDLFSIPIEISEPILKQFAQFCFLMHENGIEFLDHSPGNTLIKKSENNKYDFFLVDLNRMKFHKTKMDINMRMKNICKITPGIIFIEIISKEYARIIKLPEQKVFDLLHKYSTSFYKRFDKKKELKKYLYSYKVR